MSKTRITKDNCARSASSMRKRCVRALRRIAHEIIERNPRSGGASSWPGFRRAASNGATDCGRSSRQLRRVGVATGVIDVSMHRDDVGTRTGLPVVRASQLPLPLEQRTVVIVDDVLFTGRTCRAAMDALNSFGRPARIQFAALIDRGHRELPIRPDLRREESADGAG